MAGCGKIPLVASWLLLAACGPAGEADRLASRTVALVGVPENGYPNYQERLMLVAINRARADPNVTGETKAACSADYPARKPLMLNLAGSRCARFHCQNCIVNDGGLTHDSYCTLRSDIGDTFESSCHGEASCACEPGSEHFSCQTLGGHGTSPWSRCGYFGYSADGEVGSAGYADGWAAVWGWMSECAGADGHRRILSGAHNEIGLGYYTGSTSCYSRLYFGDTGAGGPATVTLPSGVHYPERGRNVDFFLNVYDPGGAPREVNLVLDGECLPMQLEIGTAGQGTYKLHVNMDPGCHRYWFLARTSAGQRATWPERGAWGAGDCQDYTDQAPPADCEQAPDDGGDGGGDAGGTDGGPGADAGGDGGAADDGGGGSGDEGSSDAGVAGDDGAGSDDGGELLVTGGCSCGRHSSSGSGAACWLPLVTWLGRKKRRFPARKAPIA